MAVVIARDRGIAERFLDHLACVFEKDTPLPVRFTLLSAFQTTSVSLRAVTDTYSKDRFLFNIHGSDHSFGRNKQDTSWLKETPVSPPYVQKLSRKLAGEPVHIHDD